MLSSRSGRCQMPSGKPFQLVRRITAVRDIGAAVRAVRKEAGADQAAAAGLAGVGVRFLGDLERGKESLRLGLVLRVLDRLGLELWIAPRNWRPGP
jgi:HTH-type transcriptional regulator / antitoxin HipB